MRSAHLAVTSLVVGIATLISISSQSRAGEKPAAHKQLAQAQTVRQPTFDDCFRLAWVRGVHVELGEMPEFYVLCKEGQVPFETGNPADSVRLGSN